MKWVRAKRIIELAGLGERSPDNYRADGTWLEDVHWTRAPNGTIWYNIEAIEAWVEKRPLELSPGRRVSA